MKKEKDPAKDQKKTAPKKTGAKSGKGKVVPMPGAGENKDNTDQPGTNGTDTQLPEKPDSQQQPGTSPEQDPDKELEIMEASIKEDSCNYKYEILVGVGKGDHISRDGNGIIHQDLKDAIDELRIHLAIIDDAIKVDSDIDPELAEGKLIGLMDHPAHDLFNVNGFKISGTAGDESVILLGSKWVTFGGNKACLTPKVKLQSQYPFRNQLEAALNKCRQEVVLYMEGKTKPKMIQAELGLEDTTQDGFDELAAKAEKTNF